MSIDLTSYRVQAHNHRSDQEELGILSIQLGEEERGKNIRTTRVAVLRWKTCASLGTVCCVKYRLYHPKSVPEFAFAAETDNVHSRDLVRGIILDRYT